MDLHHKVYGSGETVVILHGLFGMSDNWKTIARQLSDNYSVVLIDLPNHGRSPRLDSFNLADIAEAVYEFLTHNWMYEIRLVGHSLGAKVAMTMAQQYPDLIEQLVLVDMGPQAYKSGHQLVFDALHNVDVANLTSRSEADAQLAEYINDAGTRLFLMKNLKRVEAGFEWKFDLPTLYRDYNEIIQPLNTDEIFSKPTLFIKGGDSNYLDYDVHAELIHSIFPTARLKTIENAGHWIHSDQPELLEKTLRSFFQSAEVPYHPEPIL